MRLTNLNRVHFIGIAGSGMAAIALVAHKQGIKVSGSDLKPSRYLQALLDAGVPVSFGHAAQALDDASIELVVISTAIPADNPELLAALAKGLPIWHRAQMLAWLGGERELLAVTGTHGKTTTSSMLACALLELGADPTFVVGGVVCALESASEVGNGRYFVVEADESDSSFTYLDPTLAIVTNIEADHLDHFANLEEVTAAFRAFLAKLRPEGIAIVCADDAALVALAREQQRPVLTYGLAATADLRLLPDEQGGFWVRFADGQQLQLALPRSPGLHNLLNATAVLAALDWLGFDRQQSVLALAAFKGVHRRFDLIGSVNEVAVIDDYGHHPTEVAATIAAAWEVGYRRVHVLFQPHRYTRTKALMEQFSQAFDQASTLCLMPIYRAGEEPLEGISSETLLAAIQQHQPLLESRLLSQRETIPAQLAALAEPGDCVICLGAGDVTQEAPLVLAALAEASGAALSATSAATPAPEQPASQSPSQPQSTVQ